MSQLTSEQGYFMTLRLIEAYADSAAASVLPIFEAAAPSVADDDPPLIRSLLRMMPTPAERTAEFRQRVIESVLSQINKG